MHYHAALFTAILGLSAVALGAPTRHGTSLLSSQSPSPSSSLDSARREDDGVFVADGFKRLSDDDASGVNKEHDGVFVADGFKKRDEYNTFEADKEEDEIFVAGGFKKYNDDDTSGSNKGEDGVFAADGFRK